MRMWMPRAPRTDLGVWSFRTWVRLDSGEGREQKNPVVVSNRGAFSSCGGRTYPIRWANGPGVPKAHRAGGVRADGRDADRSRRTQGPQARPCAEQDGEGLARAGA